MKNISLPNLDHSQELIEPFEASTARVATLISKLNNETQLERADYVLTSRILENMIHLYELATSSEDISNEELHRTVEALNRRTHPLYKVSAEAPSAAQPSHVVSAAASEREAKPLDAVEALSNAHGNTMEAKIQDEL